MIRARQVGFGKALKRCNPVYIERLERVIIMSNKLVWLSS
jgi:hypothetical protein